MYARSSTIQASPGAIDEGIAYLRDTLMPAIVDMAGCIGLSLLVDRQSGRCIATSSWETEQAMRATSGTMTQIRERGTDAFGGTIESIDEWEIALLHRAHDTMPGSCARVTWLKADPAQADRAVDVFRTTILPAVDQIEGFCSASVMLDRSTGRSVSTFAYDTRQAVERSRERARELRGGISQELGAEVQDVHEFELAIAHLRVPELV